ncbi:MAG: GntR family transcriptional regulator [Halanaerobiales bacterium]|nr:GntR family transcriptional regulator [Halanaerobiales bacterium]
MNNFNRNKPVPLYYQLKEMIKKQIENKDLKPRDCLPSEREYSERFQISRMTVRQAITELVNEGLLYRQQGKGTFVADPKIEQGLMKLTSFTEDMLKRGLEPSARLLSIENRIADERIANILNLDENRQIIIIKRLRLADGESMAIEACHLSHSIFSEIVSEDLENKSLYKLLETRYKINLVRAKQVIEPATAQLEDVKLLNVQLGDPILVLGRTTFDQNDNPVEFVSSRYRGDRYKFFVELKKI